MVPSLRFRLLRFGVCALIALVPLGFGLRSWFPAASREAFPLYPTPQRGLLPGPKPCWAFVTPLAPDAVRRDTERARMQSLLFEDRQPAALPLFLVVVGHGYAHSVDQVLFRLVETEPRRYRAGLRIETRTLDSKIDPDPPEYRQGAIAPMGSLAAGQYEILVELPGGPVLAGRTVRFEVVDHAEAAPASFLLEREFLQRALRQPAASEALREVQRHVVGQMIPKALGLAGTYNLAVDPLGQWPSDPTAASTAAFPHGDEAWFAEGLARCALDPDERGVRLWASLSLSYLAVDRPAYHARLRAAAAAPFGLEALRMLSSQGDPAVLGLALAHADRSDLRRRCAELVNDMLSARRRGWAPEAAGSAPPPWDRVRELACAADSPPGDPLRQALIAALGTFHSETCGFLPEVLQRLEPAAAIVLLQSLPSSVETAQLTALLGRCTAVSSPVVRLTLLQRIGGGACPPDAIAAAVVSGWLTDPETRRYSRPEGAFAREAVQILARHAGSAEREAVRTACQDLALDRQTRLAFAVLLSRIGSPEDAGVLDRMVQECESSPDSLAVLRRALANLATRQK